MIIPITFSPDSSTSNSKLPSTLAKISHDEIVLIELQGSLDAGEGAPPSERNGKFVGKLSIDDELKKPTLLIGHHLLEGKVAPIPKPLAIMHRTNSAANFPSSSSPSLTKDPDENMDVDSDVNNKPELPEDVGGEGEESSGMEVDRNIQTTPSHWTIIGLVKRKIIFSKRPMPIIKR